MSDPTRPAAQLTVRALLTGMLLGATLSLCNVYAGLKIGWGFNMSITAALLSFGFWQSGHHMFGTRKWGMLENNINQTAASAAASISSAGLVAPIPALTMLTGKTLSYPALVAWTASVALVGVVVAISLRRQMLVVDKLPFPMGVATAETLKEMYARGKEAIARVTALVVAGVVAAALKVAVYIFKIGKLALPGAFTTAEGGKLASAGVSKISLKNLTFAVDPSALMAGLGAIVGFRAGASMLLGAIAAWGVLGPIVLESGWVDPGAADKGWFGPMIQWMLWPGVVMMVCASLTSFGFSWRSVVAAIKGARQAAAGDDDSPSDGVDEVPRKRFLQALLAAAVLSIGLQIALFGISWPVAIFGIMLTFALALVAARVAGETGITPVGAMGKVTQLSFGVVDPGNVTSNLMAANVTGGAASQCADLLHDMKAGQLIGASARLQSIAQALGVIAGAFAGCAAYLVLIPDPKGMLLTEEWAAPAVAQWKGVAEILTLGIDKLPPGTMTAMVWAAGIGVLLAVLEKTLPTERAKWIPSPTAIGIACCIPAFYSIMMFLGGTAALALNRWFPDWSKRFVIVIASGAIAGDSLAGVALAIKRVLMG